MDDFLTWDRKMHSATVYKTHSALIRSILVIEYKFVITKFDVGCCR